MKTLLEYEKQELDFDKFVKPFDEVDLDLINNLSYYVGKIHDYENNIMQIDEACDSDKDGNLRYDTFLEQNDKFYYMGLYVNCCENDLSYIKSKIKDIK